jgi:hypothetical protein
MSGLGDVTYREQVEFKDFRNKVKEAIDDPDPMTWCWHISGTSNKEPMQSYKDPYRNATIIKKKKK